MTTSIWHDTARALPQFPRIEKQDVHVDVAVVGGGITGVTLSTLLELAGKRVALFEARRLGSGATSGTTAHLTEAVDTRYVTLEKRFGRDGAKLVAESSRAAIEQIAELCRKFRLGCEFERLPGYLFTEDAEEAETLAHEREAARRAGLDVELERPPLPIPVKAGLRFPQQAAFNPLSYVNGLASRLSGDRGSVFEDSRVISVQEGEPCTLQLEHGVSVRADYVVLATHAPINTLLLQTKVAEYRSYAVSGAVAQAAHGLFWDTADPYHYVRSYRVEGETHLIVGGEDHKTGQEEDTEAPLERLAEYAARVGLKSPSHRWSAQIVEPVDGLPFIGRNARAERIFVATGFGGNGMTFGTLAAMMLSDACLGRQNPYAELYDATRVKPLASLTTYLSENVDFPLYLIANRLVPTTAESLSDVKPGEGKIVRVQGEPLAVYRDGQGVCHAVSPVCTHLGCHVAFNTAERTWDCPCHGSRFGLDGGVLEGPALKPLEQKTIHTVESRRTGGPERRHPARRAE